MCTTNYNLVRSYYKILLQKNKKQKKYYTI